jgi:iron complex outermembrane recepter protein
MKTNNLFSWLKLLALTAMLSTLIPTGAVAQTDDDEDELEELETFAITGSRIKRLDLEPVNPVVQLTRETLDSTGYSTVGDAIRSLPSNSGQSLVPSDAGTSFTPGISTFNLRGLGNNNVLVLVNGRRAAPFGSSGFNGFQTLFDFNSLPTSAIDSIEILKDGGSAVYGSDAVSGVVDIKLRKDYEGMNLTLGVGDSTETGMLEKSAFFLWGATNAKTSIVVTADWYARDRVWSRDLDWTNSADKRNRGGSDDRSSAPFPSNVVPSYNPYEDADGNQVFLVQEFDNDDNLTNEFLTTNDDLNGDPLYLRQFTIPGGSANTGGDISLASLPGTNPDSLPITTNNIYPAFVTFPGPLANPTIADAMDSDFDTVGRYDFLSDPIGGSDLFPEMQMYGFYTSVTHNLTDNIYAFGEFSYRRVEIESRSAPAPVFSFNENGDAPDGSLNIPAENPFNPFGADIDFQHRFRIVEAGNRINELVSDTPRFLVGLGGDFMEDWTWEIGWLWNDSTTSNSNPGTVTDERLQNAYNGVDFVNEETGATETVYINPFGPSDPRIIDYITLFNPTKSTYRVSTLDASVSGKLFDLPGGPLGIAAGVEYREEELDDVRTALNESGGIVGGSEGSSVKGYRDVKSAYVELAVPVISMVEFQVAARYEEYSDFGDTTKPKFAVKVRPHDWVQIRGSYGQSFLAPNLPFLFAATSTSFSSGFLQDPLRPQDPATQIKQLGGGNPDLEPEETDTYYVGIAFEPDGALDGFYASVDYFIFDSTNLIDRLSAQEVLRDFADDPTFVTRKAPEPGAQFGQIESISVQWQNLSTQRYEGIDYVIGHNFPTTALGEFRVKFEATQLLSFEREDSDLEGTWLYPEWRGNLTLAWNYGDWAASMYVNYVHERDDGSFSGTDADGNDIQLEGIDYYQSHFIFNPQISYKGITNTTITLGARNIFNEAPPFDNNDPIGYSVGVNDGTPRYVYLRVSRDF